MHRPGGRCYGPQACYEWELTRDQICNACRTMTVEMRMQCKAMPRRTWKCSKNQSQHSTRYRPLQHLRYWQRAKVDLEFPNQDLLASACHHPRRTEMRINIGGRDASDRVESTTDDARIQKPTRKNQPRRERNLILIYTYLYLSLTLVLESLNKIKHTLIYQSYFTCTVSLLERPGKPRTRSNET